MGQLQEGRKQFACHQDLAGEADAPEHLQADGQSQFSRSSPPYEAHRLDD